MIRWGKEAADLREMVTPEGVPLRFSLATHGERLTAFLLDLAFMVTLVVAIVMLALFTLGGGGYLQAFIVLLLFLVRSFYFAGFEYALGGATPGKRLMRLRVVDRQGGPLTPAAIFGRNLTRELEFFLPVSLLAAPQALYPGADGWVAWASTAWAFVFLVLPALNRDRLRVGDLVAGTMVVRAPRATLLTDVAAGQQRAFSFSASQLSHYGNYELQVLEDLLRKAERVDEETLEVVTNKIRARIDYGPVAAGDQTRFLHDFYAAQRAALERGLLFGKRKADKSEARRTR